MPARGAPTVVREGSERSERTVRKWFQIARASACFYRSSTPRHDIHQSYFPSFVEYMLASQACQARATPPDCRHLLIYLKLQALEIYAKAAQEDGDAKCGYRVSLMALKCLNNAVWDQPAGQMSLVRLGGLNVLVGLLQVRGGTGLCVKHRDNVSFHCCLVIGLYLHLMHIIIWNMSMNLQIGFGDVDGGVRFVEVHGVGMLGPSMHL